MTWQAEVLCAGGAQGEVMRLSAALSFWGGVDTVTSKVTLAGHPQLGDPIADKILVIPQLIGSSSSSAVLLELIRVGMGPIALILGARDAILPVGVVVAGQMGWPTIPVLVLPDPPFETGEMLSIDTLGHISRG